MLRSLSTAAVFPCTVLESRTVRDRPHEVEVSLRPAFGKQAVGYVSDEYRLANDDDVLEILRMGAGAASPEQTFTLSVEHLDQHGPGPIKLAAMTPRSRPE